MHSLTDEVGKVFRSKWLILGLAILIGSLAGAVSWAAPDPTVEAFLQSLFSTRVRALATGASAKGLDRLYDVQTQSGRFALAHEVGRIEYLQAWAPARGLKVITAAPVLTNLRVKVQGDRAEVSLIVRTKLVYQYQNQTDHNEMGVGSWHWLELVRKDGTWHVNKDFYLDALGSEWSRPYVPVEIRDPSVVQSPVPRKGQLDRQGAAAYAEKYCGAAWGCGNSSDYNERYNSYRNLGGDCANFASQALAEGGGLKPTWIWRKGSTCWLNAQSFVSYLTGSGRSTLLARGTYSKVEPALKRLQPGDIIGYQSKGSVTHVAIVTGRDSAGVPLVAAHTADRFRNPWDLGWDRSTVFWLIHLHD
jgi:hypothetical protein